MNTSHKELFPSLSENAHASLLDFHSHLDLRKKNNLGIGHFETVL